MLTIIIRGIIEPPIPKQHATVQKMKLKFLNISHPKLSVNFKHGELDFASDGSCQIGLNKNENTTVIALSADRTNHVCMRSS